MVGSLYCSRNDFNSSIMFDLCNIRPKLEYWRYIMVGVVQCSLSRVRRCLRDLARDELFPTVPSFFLADETVPVSRYLVFMKDVKTSFIISFNHSILSRTRHGTYSESTNLHSLRIPFVRRKIHLNSFYIVESMLRREWSLQVYAHISYIFT